MNVSRLLMLGLLYLPIGFVLGYVYTNYTQDSNTQEVIDSTSLSPWEARYHDLEKKFKEMSQAVDDMYSSDKSSGKQGESDKIDTKKLLESVEVLVNSQYSELETDVKKNIMELCQSVLEEKEMK